eukprot:jgi/Ulvmu1/4942/UM205_0004.1
MRTLAAALSAMLALASVHLISSQACDPSVFSPSGTPGQNLSNPISKRRRISRWMGRAEQLSLDPVIAALSTAPALTALCLSYLSGPRCSQCPCTGISGASASLQCLQIHFTSTGATTVGVAAAPQTKSSPYPHHILACLRCTPSLFPSAASSEMISRLAMPSRARHTCLLCRPSRHPPSPSSDCHSSRGATLAFPSMRHTCMHQSGQSWQESLQRPRWRRRRSMRCMGSPSVCMQLRSRHPWASRGRWRTCDTFHGYTLCIWLLTSHWTETLTYTRPLRPQPCMCCSRRLCCSSWRSCAKRPQRACARAWRGTRGECCGRRRMLCCAR